MQAGKAGARLTSRLPARQLELTVQRTTAPRLIRRPRQALSTSTRMGTQERCGAFYRRGRASPGQDGDGWRADRSQDRVSFAQCRAAQTNALRCPTAQCAPGPARTRATGPTRLIITCKRVLRWGTLLQLRVLWGGVWVWVRAGRLPADAVRRCQPVTPGTPPWSA